MQVKHTRKYTLHSSSMGGAYSVETRQQNESETKEIPWKTLQRQLPVFNAVL